MADLTAWLGDYADQLDGERRDTLDRTADVIAARWPDPDDDDMRREALTAAAQVLFGDATLEAVTAAWSQARLTEHERRAAMTGALLASSTGARSGMGSEADLIARTGLARATVRKAIGR